MIIMYLVQGHGPGGCGIATYPREYREQGWDTLGGVQLIFAAQNDAV